MFAKTIYFITKSFSRTTRGLEEINILGCSVEDISVLYLAKEMNQSQKLSTVDLLVI